MKMWICREDDGALYLFERKPTKIEIFDDTWMWMCDQGMMRIHKDIFPEVTFENSPMEVELEVIKK